jgi:DNA recombination protein RmuC
MDPMLYLIIGFAVGLVSGGIAAGIAIQRIMQERLKAAVESLRTREESWTSEFNTMVEAKDGELTTLRAAKDQEIQNMKAGFQRELKITMQSETKLREEAVAGLQREKKIASDAAQAEKVNLIRQLQDYRADEDRMKNAFKVLAQDSLRTNKAEFLQEAQGKVAPLVAAHAELQVAVRTLDGKREAAYADLTQRAQALLQETQSLNRLLNNPQMRGNWGELHLQRVIEMSGLQEHVDFNRQVAADGIRPDVVVGLPGRREVIVDSKVPLDAFRRGVEAETDVDRQRCFTEHVQAVRSRITDLSKKEYQSQFESLDFVILFIPIDAAYYAALQADKELFEFKASKRVFLAGPVTLLAILRSIAYGWREVAMVQNASKIGELAEELHKRLKKFAEYVDNVGSKLTAAVKAHNEAVGSFQGRLLVQARTLESYIAIEGQNLIDQPAQVQEQVRVLGLTASSGDSEAQETDLPPT